MAETLLTLNQLITINDRNLADVEVPNFLNDSPFMRTNAATIASHDTLHKWLRYSNPDVGFRVPNDGVETQVSVDTMVSTDCKILDASFRVDRALALSYRKGGLAGYINREAGRHLNAAFFEAEKQVFNGTGNKAGGFEGFPDDATLATLDGGMVVNAGGSTASSQTSVYIVRSGMDDVEIITGHDGDISIGDTTVQETAGTTGTYGALYTPITAWYALKIGSTVSSVARIANVETSLTDDMLYEAISMFGAGRQPTHIYMNRKALELLRSSRTATSNTGSPAVRPADLETIPIILTDGILNTEAVVVSS